MKATWQSQEKLTILSAKVAEIDYKDDSKEILKVLQVEEEDDDVKEEAEENFDDDDDDIEMSIVDFLNYVKKMVFSYHLLSSFLFAPVFEKEQEAVIGLEKFLFVLIS